MNPRNPLSTALSFAAAITLVAGTGTPAAAGLANSAWPMFQHDAQHSGRTDVNGPQTLPTVAWYAKTRSRLRASVAVDDENRVFVPNGKNPLSAFDATTGIELWESSNHKGGHADRSSPAVNDVGVVYQGARDNDLWAVDTATGAVNWRYHVPHDGDVTTPPTVADDGSIYMGSEALGAGYFYRMTPAGLPAWTVPGAGGNVEEDGHIVLRGSFKNASPCLSHDNSVAFVSIKTDAIAVDTATGAELWRVWLAKKGFGSRHPNYAPTLSNDGSQVYFQSREGLYALDVTDGSTIWLFTPPEKQELKSAAAIGADGTIYIGASKKKNSHLYALDPIDGSVKWRHFMGVKGKFSNNQAAVGADGKIYVGLGKTVIALNPGGDGFGNGDLVWQMPLPGKIDAGVVIGGPGVLYVGAGKNLWKLTD